jgi:hypothetical protein
MVWTPGKGGSKAAKDYYKEKQAEYGRRPDKKEKKVWSGDYDKKGDGSKDTGGLSKQNQNIKDETARRIAAGDTSAYVKKSAKKFGLTVPTRHTYDPTKVSRTIQHVDTTGMNAKDAYRANQAFFAQQANNEKIIAQNARRRAVEEAFHKRGNVNRSDFTGKVEGSGIFGTNIGAKYSGKPKLREGLTGNEYHDWMRKLYDVNPPMMEQIFPWGSGKTVRDLASMTGPGRLLKGIGSVGRDVAGAMGEGLGKIFPGMAKDLTAEKNRFMKNFDNIGPNITRDVKKMLGLSPAEEANLNIINKELNSDQKDLQGVLKAQNDDWTSPILGDDIKDAENKIMDEKEKELALAKEILFGVDDPTQDLPLETDENVHRNYWSEGYTLPLQQDPGFDEEYEETREDIFDVSQNRMPHVPITREQKVKAVDEAYNWLPGASTGDEDWVLEDNYNRMREAQEKGMEYGPWEGVVANPYDFEFDEWQSPGISEIQDQIRWNTANRPLGTNYWEQPELTEDFIQDNITTTDWGWNKGGYLEKYDDGGYANMSTFEKLKAINDSIAEG